MRWLLETAVRVQQLNHTAAEASSPPGTATTLPSGAIASQSQSQSPPPPATDSFDANMVIILAALLCALILALGLNSILRCALRCSTFTTTTTSSSSSKPPRGGLKKGALRKLPVAVYGTESAGGIAATECPICLGDFEGGEQVRALPGCGHGFHARCVDAWLVSNSSCPTCRRSLLAPDRDAKAARVAPAAPEAEPRMGYRPRAFFMPSVVISPPPPMV